ncbi:type I-MYXAN CRISPR-associated protein Cmx8 [Chondromyces crocatus]|uniref:type I-MYXAN CRISPR-associated protein Cmx8 n=1 Tax=Chondromyces crocatus TaxID=52 RepID=UPI00067DE246|nr:type I-MYXAN CRISPR-associated protein Cmx8 [Chondromyces crocatus]
MKGQGRTKASRAERGGEEAASKGKPRAGVRGQEGTDEVAPEGPIELTYSLAELPSAQHRAGLAGLVMLVAWLARQPAKERGICSITRLEAGRVSLRLDLTGVKRLLDAMYDASHEEVAVQTPWKRRGGELVEPLRVEEREVQDPKSGTSKKKKFHIYPVVVPRGAFLVDHEPPTANGTTLWIKLWRDMVWAILRGIPTQRLPFEARAEERATTEHLDAWADLTGPADKAIKLPGTYFIGAQERSAENVGFRDLARQQFLLHFLPIALQVYVPRVVSIVDGTSESGGGYVIVVPDVADLATFCDELPRVLKERETDVAGFRPRAAVILLPAEGALDMARRLKARIASQEGRRSTADLLVALEVYHLEKQGNSVRLLGAWRLDLEDEILDEYTHLRGMRLRSDSFKRQRLLNLLDRAPWYRGFDRIAETTSYKEVTIGSKSFRHDARLSFEVAQKNREATMQQRDGKAPERLDIEEIVYSVARTYVSQKLSTKYGLEWKGEWKDSKADDARKSEYNAKKEKIAKEAFLAVRSRSGAAFASYFVGSLCSVPQYLSKARYEVVAHALAKEPDRVRTLTLLALSAAG